MKLNREIVHSLHFSGMSFAEIGRMYNVTRQYVYQIFSGYDTIYKRENETYKMKKRHRGHTLSTKLTKPCELCVKEQNVNGVASL